MTKTFEKAVTGFNHNIKHKGKVYHVQTEDSGVNNPHIITHLFVGGNILASKKTSYADILNAENLAEVIPRPCVTGSGSPIGVPSVSTACCHRSMLPPRLET